MDDAQNEALAALTNQMFAGEIAEGSVVVTDPEPVAAPAPVVPAPAPVAPAAVVAAPAAPVAVAPGPVEAPEEVPTFKPKLDDDQRALLEEPDFEEEARAEVEAEVEDGDYDYDSDPTMTAKLRALEKRNKYLEDRDVKKSKKGWVEEAKRIYPDLARLIPGEIEGIQATSRRALLRAADEANTKYATVLAPTLARLEAERAAIAAGAVATARNEVANAWGRPAADTLPSDAAATADALARARATGSLEESIKVLMKDNPVL